MVNTKAPESMKQETEVRQPTEEIQKEMADDRGKSKWYEPLLKKTKEFFEAEPDRDFL
jgi:hypothetical protein